ncbi:MAG: hypothetical protein FWG78_00155 [Coriobacteriia bacterium]|nr:hypothetical protein [Coriobacteriia bacterium]
MNDETRRDDSDAADSKVAQSESQPIEEPCDHIISCFKKIAGTLTREEIQAHGLIVLEDGSKSNNYKSATVDLTLGNCHYIYDGNKKNSDDGNSGNQKWKLWRRASANGNDEGDDQKWSPAFVGDPELLEDLNKKYSEAAPQYRYQNRANPNKIKIPPYGSALIQLHEIVDTHTVATDPNKGYLVVGRFDLRLEKVQQGLVSQQGTQIGPCYKGRLFCFIHNFSNEPVYLSLGERIATAEFSYVSCFCEADKRSEIIKKICKDNAEKYEKKLFCDDKGIQEVRYFWKEGRLPGDCGLLGLKHEVINEINSDDTIRKIALQVEKRAELRLRWTAAVIALVAALASAALSVLLSIWLPGLTGVNERIADIEKRIDAVEVESIERERTSEDQTVDAGDTSDEVISIRNSSAYDESFPAKE